MNNSLKPSLEDFALRIDQVEVASYNNKITELANRQDEDICDVCLDVPWENFGASDDPAGFTAREPFMSWKYLVAEGRTWPGNSTCRICRFMRDLLAEYGFESTTSVRRLRGGWDGEKPFRMTFLELDQDEDRSVGSGRSKDGHNRPRSEDDSEVQSDGNEDEGSEQESDDDAYTVWEDDDDAYHTFSVPSFFATSLNVEAFQSAMQGYKPTDANLNIVKSWLDECNSAHNEKCHLRNRRYVRNLKVIDCARKAIVPAPPDSHFVALSYVWGLPSAQPNLTSSDLTLVLPRTIEDSIVVTQELGFTYLWIDRYCINQDDDQEKQEQIAQMADIYASAAVTIIAAAGEDPSYGLPGVQKNSRGLARFEQVRSTRLFANPSIEPRHRYSPYYVHESKWASRAWTFQECYNSPRRLFFTTEQITLVCNTAAFQEIAGSAPCPPSHPIHTNLRGWVSAIDERPVRAAILDAIPYPLASIMDTLNIYSQRQMSYDSDALNAILGTLNTFTRHSIHHLWGVPMLLPVHEASNQLLTGNATLDQYKVLSSSADGEGPSHEENSIALLWHNRSPCYRRTGFPSWSPLGWREEYAWLPRQGIGWSTRQTPPASGSDFLTLLASCHGVKTIARLQPHVSDMLATAHYEIAGAVSQQLVVETHTVWLRLVLSPAGLTSDQYRDCVAIKVDDDLEVLLAATWDKRPWEMDVNIHLKGCFLDVAHSSACCSDSPHHVLIIAEQHGENWERVAMALITNNYVRSKTKGAESICDFTTAYPPLFRQISTGALYTWDQRSFDERNTESLDLSHLKFQHNEPWWKRCSQLQTTTLV